MPRSQSICLCSAVELSLIDTDLTNFVVAIFQRGVFKCFDPDAGCHSGARCGTLLLSN